MLPILVNTIGIASLALATTAFHANAQAPSQERPRPPLVIAPTV